MSGTTHRSISRRVRRSRFAALAVAGVMFGGFVGVAVPTSVSAATASEWNITFDGHCDGLHLVVPSAGIGAAPTVDGHVTISPGCAATTDGVFGIAQPNKNGIYGVSKGTEYVFAPEFGAMFKIMHNRTWTMYGYSGNTIALLETGTWSYGTPPLARAKATSASVEPRSPVTRARPATSRDISFDGFCDGLHINSPSLGLGTSTTIDGYDPSVDCFGATAPMIGVKAVILGAKGTLIATINYHGALITFTIYKNHTFAAYTNTGNTIHQVASGTWSPGAPLAAVSHRSTLSNV